MLTHLWRTTLTRKTPQGKHLQTEILPQWQSALKWGLGEVQPGSTPSGHTAELPSPVLQGLTGCCPQLLNQCSGHDSAVTIHQCIHFFLQEKCSPPALKFICLWGTQGKKKQTSKVFNLVSKHNCSLCCTEVFQTIAAKAHLILRYYSCNTVPGQWSQHQATGVK